MTSDPRFAARVRRLVSVSAFGLGTITALAWRDGAPAAALAALALGWVLMPTLLYVSLRRPRSRYLLAVPATLVGGGLVLFMVTGVAEPVRAGWLLVTSGVWLGALLGMWTWFRWLPVPAAFDDPFSPWRWVLVFVHAGSVLAGIALVVI